MLETGNFFPHLPKAQKERFVKLETQESVRTFGANLGGLPGTSWSSLQAGRLNLRQH